MLSGKYSLVQYQLYYLRRQLPWNYLLLAANTTSLAAIHYAVAPVLLTTILPILLVGGALSRVAYWWIASRQPPEDEQTSTRRLRIVTWLSAMVGGVFTVWALALGAFSGDIYYGYIMLFTGLSLLGALVSLIHTPRVAIYMTAGVLAPLIAYNLWSGSAVRIAVALSIALVAGLVLRMLFDSHRTFTRLLKSQQALALERGEAVRLIDENLRLAHTDPLTGMPNRRSLFAQIRKMLEAGNGSAPPFCIALLDLDRFKLVNDSYGHATGDRVLVETARRLNERAGKRLFVARLGGDEFGLLFQGSQAEGQRIVEQLCALVRQPIDLDDLELRIGCSAGIAFYPDAGTNAETLFARSDYALHHVKTNRRGECAVFTSAHEDRVRDAQRIESTLQSADLDRELSVHFQPIYDTRTMTVRSVEALARWNSPTLGLVPAEMLILTAERSGKMGQVTLHLFEKALAAITALPPTISLSFNLSADDIASGTTMRELIAMVLSTRVPPDRFIFEVTETSLVRDFDGAREVLGRLRTLGMRVALDDFGTGYSSLHTLQDLPLDIVKVDRSFAARMVSPAGRQIVSAIRNLGQSLGLECTMEGIETEEQLVETSRIGYRYAQGYLLGKPVPLEELKYSLPGSLGAAVPGMLAKPALTT
ncbi:EAL domain-containing protein [Stakelama sp. CBK3Z-3]|uniref:EAL domain-containing protein n=1 Tax=Stakelama flava TaxID=2860338 RepID=A0ABS6XJU5_9SPHN|nr:EAL domain-containing protein [Stakelama flava]MBW4330462.1 EAL domain-containing protein [Stakelama flava]